MFCICAHFNTCNARNRSLNRFAWPVKAWQTYIYILYNRFAHRHRGQCKTMAITRTLQSTKHSQTFFGSYRFLFHYIFVCTILLWISSFHLYYICTYICKAMIWNAQEALWATRTNIYIYISSFCDTSKRFQMHTKPFDGTNRLVEFKTLRCHRVRAKIAQFP